MVDWDYLPSNPNAVNLLEQNQGMIAWDCLSSNQNSIHLLGQNLNYIDWFGLSLNPNIFEIDYYSYTEKVKHFF